MSALRRLAPVALGLAALLSAPAGCSSTGAGAESLAPLGPTPGDPEGASTLPEPWDPVDPMFKGCEGG